MATFEAYTPLLIAVEGGYQAMPADSGNYNSRGELVGTNYGISAKVYEKWINRPPSVTDMKTITKTIALEIYKAWYWNKIGGSFINNQSIANIIIDHAVNAGVYSAGKMVQTILNEQFNENLSVDGAIGTLTLKAINNAAPEVLHEAIIDARAEFYESIGGTFLKGWLKRLNAFVFEKKKAIAFGTVAISIIGIGLFLVLKNQSK